MNDERARKLITDTWGALAIGDVGPLRAVLTPDAQWRAVEDGPWNCVDRDMILDVMSTNLRNGLSGSIEEITMYGANRVLVGFRPSQPAPEAWPLENGIRWMVLTLRGDLVAEMKGCATRADAVSYGSIG